MLKGFSCFLFPPLSLFYLSCLFCIQPIYTYDFSVQTHTKLCKHIPPNLLLQWASSIDSTGRPLEILQDVQQNFYWTSNRNSIGHPLEIFITFVDEIGNSKTLEANLQNSSGHPIESYWTSSRILENVQQNLGDVQQKFYWTSSRPDDLQY